MNQITAGVPHSNGLVKQKSEMCSPATFVASTSRVSFLPDDVGKQVVHGEESGNIYERNTETVSSI